jgi:hypothetical protein
VQFEEITAPGLCDLAARYLRPFANFSELNFAQVGHGIGRYSLVTTPGALAGRLVARRQLLGYRRMNDCLR